MSDTSGKNGSSGCQEFRQCLEILYLMLDNEASGSQEDYFHKHVDHCMVCFEHYEVEKHIRELLKARLANQPVPSDLAQTIRQRIFQSV